MGQIKKWDAGGLQASSDPGPGKPSDCFTVVHATNSGFKIEPWKANDGIYNCDPANVVTITREARTGTTLAERRQVAWPT